MTPRSVFVTTAAASLLLIATTMSAQATDAAAQSPGVSKVRIVRLSEVKGQVQLDRNIDRGFEPGITNLPIVEKNRLRTEEGVAEIEFEDNSTLRIAPNSEVDFPTLERQANGATASSVHLVKGMAYLSLVKSNGANQFNLLFADQNLSIPAPSHIRLQLDGTEAQLAVLDGNLKIGDASGATLDVSKKKTVTFDLLQHQQPTVAKDILPEPYDTWDHDATGYHARVANSAFSNSPYSYGTNDLAYYGSFVDGCGGGQMWRPYFTSAAWDPYSNGAWAYYQGAGYSWVSPYPWGWMPYHYGSWSFCPGMGWGWQPGGMWNGLNNYSYMPMGGGTGVSGSGGAPAMPGHGRLIPPPVHPPRTGEPSLLAVNAKPLVKSSVVSGDKFAFRNDSAGLGVPRGDFGKLNKFSQTAQSHGTADQHVYFSAPPTAMPANGHPTSTTALAGSMHRGSAPPPTMSGAAAQGPGNHGGNPGSYPGGNQGGYSGRNSGQSAPSMPSSAPAPSHPSSAPSSGSGRPH